MSGDFDGTLILLSRVSSRTTGAGLHDGSLDRVFAEAAAMEEDESMRGLASATHPESTTGQRTRDIVPRTLADCASPGSLKNKFRNIPVGGMRAVSVERVVAEAEAQVFVRAYRCPTSRETGAVPESAQAGRAFPR